MSSSPVRPLTEPAAAPSLSPFGRKWRWQLLIFLPLVLACGISIWWGISFLNPLITFHPTGKIVFECWPERRSLHLCLVNADGSGYTQLTSGTDHSPSWSPDGKRIAFARQMQDSTTTLFIMNSDGSGLTQLKDVSILANFKDGDYGDIPQESPSWSPGGDQLAFNALSYDLESFSSGIAVANATGGGVTFLTSSSEKQPRWSPDGARIAYVKYGKKGEIADDHIYVMDVDGSNQTELSKIFSSSPSWSPDGTKLAFTCIDTDQGKGGVCVMDSDGSGLMMLVTRIRDFNSPSWSPDGTKITFICVDTDQSEGNICAMNSDGSGLTVLAQNALSPTWSPDGAYIAYYKRDPTCLPFACPVTGQLWVMRADGSQQTKITDGPVDQNPVWGPVP